MRYEVTKLGERGQVVIPQAIRNKLKLQKGDKFMVFECAGVISLQHLKLTKEQWKDLIKKTKFKI
jgi:AbrB family looped-hinge helix DNA binding protein